MKTVSVVTSVVAALTMAMLPAKATQTFVGTGNALGASPADGAGISSVVVNNDLNNITFTINSTQAQAAWIFYAIDIQIVGQAGSGYTTLANPIWAGGPAVGISTGENAVLDFNNNGASNTGGIAFKYSGGSWAAGSSISYDAGGAGFTFTTLTVSLSSLGLSVGNSFYFDAVSTYTSWQGGYPQSAYGALDSVSGYPAETDGSYSPWNGNAVPTYYDSATDASGTTFGTAASEYTVAGVPEPISSAFLGLGALLVILRRRGVSTR